MPAFRTFLQRFGSLDRLLIVFTAPEGRTAADCSEEISGWVSALRAAPEIESVDAGVAGPDRDWAWLGEHALLLMHGPALDSALAPTAARRDDGGARGVATAAVGPVADRRADRASGSARLLRAPARSARRRTRRVLGRPDGSRLREPRRTATARDREAATAAVRHAVLARVARAARSHSERPRQTKATAASIGRHVRRRPPDCARHRSAREEREHLEQRGLAALDPSRSSTSSFAASGCSRAARCRR